VATILQLIEQAERFRWTIGRARAAHARLSQALSATERAIVTRGGSPPPALRRSRERLGALIEGSARTLASFEQVGALMAQRLEAVRVAHPGEHPRALSDVGRAP
jgi:hypothetical protein